MAGGVIKLANLPPDPRERCLATSARGFAALCKLIVEMSGHILTLFRECIAEIVSDQLPNARLIGSTELPSIRLLRDMEIPFFVDDTEFKPKG